MKEVSERINQLAEAHIEIHLMELYEAIARGEAKESDKLKTAPLQQLQIFISREVGHNRNNNKDNDRIAFIALEFSKML